jgi:uncharacterized protein
VAIPDRTTISTTTDAPVSVRERIEALDVVRGVAVSGILLANVLVFFGLDFAPPELLAGLPSAGRDEVARFLGHVFVDGKFYSLFSLLFGIGFGVQLARGGEAAVPRFRRRLRILLAIGAVHALVVWAGDILLVYALLGFTMPWFARRDDRSLMRWVIGLLALPTVLYLIMVVGMMLAGADPASTSGGGVPPFLLDRFEAIGSGGLFDAWIGNLIFFVGRWIDLVLTVRFPKVLGMFVLGLWLVRAGIAVAPQNQRALLQRWMWLGLGIGLPANLLAAWADHHWSYLPPSPGGVIAVVAQAIGIPLLALGYAATITLLVVNGRRAIRVFAPMGRMALTNYLTQTLVCVTLAYGFGFGLWWQVGASTAMAIAVGIVLLQLPFSAWWLSRHRFGPMEHLWRTWTYGRVKAR